MKKKYLSAVFVSILAILFLSGTEISAQTEAQFLASFASDVGRSLPRRLGNAEIRSTQTFCSVGCQAYFATAVLRLVGVTPNFGRQNLNMAALGQVIKNELLKDYCQTPARQRNVSIQVYLKDMYGTDLGNVAYVQASDCSAGGNTQVTSLDSQFLTNWAVEVRRDLPFVFGSMQFTGATTYCPVGCQSTTSSGSMLVLSSRTPNLSKNNVDLNQLGSSVRNMLLDKYCDKARNTNYGLWVDLVDSNSNYVGRPVTLSPRDCPAVFTPNAGQSTAPASGFVSSVEQQLWDAVKNSSRPHDFQAYLNDYPNGQYSSIARLKINQFGGVAQQSSIFSTAPSPSMSSGNSVEEQYWDTVKNSTRVQDFQSYLRDYPNGQFAPIARLRISQLGGTGSASPTGSSAEDQYWNAIANSQNAQDFQNYLNNYPSGTYAAIARVKIGQLGGASTFSPSPSVSTGSGLFSQQTTGDQILKMAQFGSLSEMANLKTFWVLTDVNDLKSRQAISEELVKAFPKLSTATAFEDADFYLVFGMTDSSGALVTDNSNRANQTYTGQLLVFTSAGSSGGQPSIRILFRSTKSQSFTQAGISLFQTGPAKNTARDLIKALEKIKF